MVSMQVISQLCTPVCVFVRNFTCCVWVLCLCGYKYKTTPSRCWRTHICSDLAFLTLRCQGCACIWGLENSSVHRIKKKIYLFKNLFLAVLSLRCLEGFSLVAESVGFSCGAQALGLSGFSGCGVWPSSCSSQALECRLSSCSARVQLPHHTWDLLGPGIKPMAQGKESVCQCSWL